MSRVAVIGAGAMGLAAAYHLAKDGHQVDVYEAGGVAGGMAAHFDFDGLSIERYYHFICKSDAPTFALLDELGIGDRLRWRTTRMGFFYRDKLYRWGDPLSLMLFPHLGLTSKIRYGLLAFMSTRRRDWSKLDRLHADDWLRAWCGEQGWNILWEKLFSLKFFEYSHDISAAWIWTRIRRVGTSRRNMFTEELGYIEGGSEVLIERLCERIRDRGGEIHLSSPVDEVNVENGAVRAITVKGERRPVDAVISTVPLPLVPTMIPSLPEDARRRYAALKNIGVVCVVLKLRKSVSPNFWVNINDDRMNVPGIIEFSRLRDVGGETVVYVPYYMPLTHSDFTEKPDADFVAESFGYLKLINPALADGDLVSSAVGRLRHSQPICPPRFLESLPPVVSAIRGLQIADTSIYYPEDRGIAESVKLGAEMAARIER